MPKKKIVCHLIVFVILSGISIYIFNISSQKKYRCDFEGLNPYVNTNDIINKGVHKLNTEELSELFDWFTSLATDDLVLNISYGSAHSKSRIEKLTSEQKKIIAGYIVQPGYCVDFLKMPILFNGEFLLSISISDSVDSAMELNSATEFNFYDFEGFIFRDVSGMYFFYMGQGLAEDFYLYVKGLL